MRQYKFLAVACLANCLCATATMAAPVFTDLDTVTPQDLVNTLLGSNSGIAINSVSYQGANIASGTFTNGNSSNIGINQGVVLSSGDLTTMTGDFSTTLGVPGNPALEAYNGGIETDDASTLTIEFTPQGNQIALSYVFASWEYPVSVDDIYNDVFAMLVNGENRALIPGTGMPITIHTINCGDENGEDATNCDLFRDNRNGDISDLGLGGFTLEFSAFANVNPGEVNTLVLSIADSQDSNVDSAVFLRAGSLGLCSDQLPCGPQQVSEPGMLGIGAFALFGIAGLRRSRRRG